METEPEAPGSIDEPDSDDAIGYRNVDEEGEYDESGSQTPGPGEPPPDEED